jgi:hypothetical protein
MNPRIVRSNCKIEFTELMEVCRKLGYRPTNTLQIVTEITFPTAFDGEQIEKVTYIQEIVQEKF